MSPGPRPLGTLAEKYAVRAPTTVPTSCTHLAGATNIEMRVLPSPAVEILAETAAQLRDLVSGVAP